MGIRENGPWLHPERKWKTEDAVQAGAETQPAAEEETAEEEVPEELDAERIAAEAEAIDGDRSAQSIYQMFCADIRRYPLLTAGQEADLSRRIREKRDEEAFQTFVLSNLRLVIAVAKRIQSKFGNNSVLTFMDLIHEGILGLITAVERFDYRRKTRFSTYAIFWIHQKIRRAISAQRPGITLPCYTGDCLRSMSEYIRNYRAGEIEKIPKRLRNRVKTLYPIAAPFASLDVDDDDEGNRSGFGTGGDRLGEDKLSADAMANLHSGTEESVTQDMFRVQLTEAVRKAVDNEMKFDVICRRFALPPYTVAQNLKEIAEHYRRSNECIRTILVTTLKKLKTDKNIHAFKDAWGDLDD